MRKATPGKPKSCLSQVRSYLIFSLALTALFALPIFIGSAAAPNTSIDKTLSAAIEDSLPIRADFSYSNIDFNLIPPQPLASSTTVETFASDCTTPKTEFNVQDADLTVCAKFMDASPGWVVIWSNARFVAVSQSSIVAPDGTATFTLNPGSNLGDWRVILFEPFGQTVQAVNRFTVIDNANPVADIGVATGAIASSSSSGGQALFAVQVFNLGPSAASSAQLVDNVPANTSFLSFAQLSGPTFTCNSPNVGDTGTTTCTIASLGRGEKAIFIATYQIGAVPNGTSIINTAAVTSGTAQPVDPNNPNSDNNTSSASIEIVSAPCQLSVPANITVPADTGQAGAVVTYDAPTGTGNCGDPSTGPAGEPIPAISCNPASGSFFPVGTTTVLCSAQTGSAVSFLVTVQNPGALSISLSGASSITIECGVRFADPGATAINGVGQPIDVDVSYTGAFNPDAPAVGTYIATYTATEEAHSVSTERTIIVTDTEGPAITVDGANPYRIQLGSCAPFVDPGASAFDACGGPKAVTSSIAGPGGATSVDPSVPGTYIVTYTASDGTHETMATRTVLVGTFPEDEVDQPGTSNVPPTLTLNGDDQIVHECGNAFTDPGATAIVCGTPVTVTTTGTVNPNTPGTYSITYSASANGFTTEHTRIITVQDTIAPEITLNGSSSMSVGFGSVFTDPGATAADGCAGNLTSSIVVTGSVNTNAVGVYTLTYSVSDASGHSDTKTRTVEVSPYNFVGFFQPIDNLPAVNEMKAGQAAPIKFSLGGNQGLNIFATGSPTSIQITCDYTAPLNDLQETETAGASSLTYDPVTDQYKYVWKTENSWKNKCRQLILTLRDGTIHRANFKFK